MRLSLGRQLNAKKQSNNIIKDKKVKNSSLGYSSFTPIAIIRPESAISDTLVDRPRRSPL